MSVIRTSRYCLVVSITLFGMTVLGCRPAAESVTAPEIGSMPSQEITLVLAGMNHRLKIL